MFSLWIGTDLASRQEIAFKFDYLSLQSLGLSNRTLNALLRYNFRMTVGDVLRADNSFASIENLGLAALNELGTKVSQLLAKCHSEVDASPSPSKQTPILTNSKTSFIAPLKVLPEVVQNLQLDQLHLEEKAHNALIAANITTIGELDNASSSLIRAMHVLSASELGSINSALIALHNSVTQENAVDWFLYWKKQKIEIILPTYTSSTSLEEIIRDLSAIIKEALNREPDGERSAIIIGSRLGLEYEAKLKLEEIANAFGGISRERVRQIEERALRVLREVFVEQHYRGRNYHVHPYVHLLIQTVRDVIEAAPNRLVLETMLKESLCQKFDINYKKVKVPLNLILSLLDAQRLEIDYPNAVVVWGYVKAEQRRSLENWIKRLDDLLTRETPLPLSELKILAHLNKKVKKSEVLQLAQLKWLIDLCSTVERCSDGFVWGKFEYLKGRGNQVERLLIMAGRPISMADITREINHRLVPLGQRQLTDANLSNQINSDGRFVPIGRSGKWGLKSWTHIDTKSVLMLMEECLITHNKPTTIDEIYSYVIERRQVSKNSITTYLKTEKGRFTRASLTTWGLAKWSNSTEVSTWNREQVAEFVAEIFRNNKVREVEYKVLKEALMKEAGINAKRAQGLLNHTPVIKTRGTTSWGGDRIAVFQSNYKAILASEKNHSRSQRVSLRQQVIESVHNILEALPGRQMPMAELIEQLHKQLACPKSTLYAYIPTIDSIEKLEGSESHIKIYKLRDSHNSMKSGTLRQQVSESVRGILEAVPNKQMSLAELITRLQKEYNCPKATLYRYIADLEYIERLDVPGSLGKLLSMKGTQGTELFPQVQNITNTTLREHLNKAVFFLTEENVDIGLFQLGRAFETTLKAFLVAAYAKGKLTSTPGNKSPDQLKLADLISCLKSNGIVTDDAALSYLRQLRNDRAHSGAPNIEERRLLMKSAQHFAGLYIDYIKWFDDLTHSL